MKQMLRRRLGTRDLDRDIKRARRIAEALLKLHYEKASVVISHRVRITNGEEELITEITLLPVKRFYKKTTGSEIVGDEDILKEVQEVKDYS